MKVKCADIDQVYETKRKFFKLESESIVVN